MEIGSEERSGDAEGVGVHVNRRGRCKGEMTMSHRGFTSDVAGRCRPGFQGRTAASALIARECGLTRASAFTRLVSSRRVRALELSDEEEVDTVGAQNELDGVFSMDLDAMEGRYLLAGGMEGSVIAYDTWAETETITPDIWAERRSTTSFAGTSSRASMRGRADRSSATPRLSLSPPYNCGGLHSQSHTRKIKSVFRLCAPSAAERTDEMQETIERSREAHMRRQNNLSVIDTVNSEMERMERLNYREDFAILLERHNERERTESRIRRMGNTNGSIDARNRRNNVRASGPATRVDRTRKYHTRRVNSVQWYPVDSGCFMTAGNDQRVIVWDANALDVATDFVFEEAVYKARMPSRPSTHCLIAVALEKSGIRLCDIVSGACTHTLVGHASDDTSRNVLTLAWCPGSEFVLASGGIDGSIRFFDIRRPGAYMVLDQHNSRSTKIDNVDAIATSNSGLWSRSGADTVPGDVHGSKKRARDHDTGYFDDGGLSSRSSVAKGARAHNGAVNAVTFTPDGMHLISSGRDNRLRLWDAITGRNTMINFPSTPKMVASADIAVSPDSTTMFLPGRWDVGVYDVYTGKQLRPLRGHFDNVNSVLFHRLEDKLYSGGRDSQILVWTANRTCVDVEI